MAMLVHRHNVSTTAIFVAVLVLSLFALCTQHIQTTELIQAAFAPNVSDLNDPAAYNKMETRYEKPAAPVYIPATLEKYVQDHAAELKLDVTRDIPDVCSHWREDSFPWALQYKQYSEQLDEYSRLIYNFKPVGDIRQLLRNTTQNEVCSSLRLKGGLENIFNSSQYLSKSNIFGFIEPLLPPLRHPKYCTKGRSFLLDLSYVIHDFAQICRKLKPTSRFVMIDMGASLQFHGGSMSPAVYLANMYRKFGMPFDHIYAFEITQIPPAEVYAKVPQDLVSSFHWINLPVPTDTSSKLHPFQLILDNFNSDDLVVVKLDIDTPHIEMQLANQLVMTQYAPIVDQFYFEHHVHMKPIDKEWKSRMEGSVLDSIRLFQSMREKGIGAHSWV